MARLKKNSILSSVQGAIGKELVFKQYTDEVIISKFPDMPKKKPSKQQAIQRNVMREANAYASGIANDPKLSKQYEKKLKPGESVYHKAKKEFFEKRKKK